MKKLKVLRKPQIKYNRKFWYLQENVSKAVLQKAILIVKSIGSTIEDIEIIEGAPDEEVIPIVLIQVMSTKEEEGSVKDVDKGKKIENMKDKGEDIEKEEGEENWKKGQGQSQVGLTQTKKSNQSIRKINLKMTKIRSLK